MSPTHLLILTADFCAPGGYVDHMGYDLKAMRAPIEPISRVLKVLAHWDLSLKLSS